MMEGAAGARPMQPMCRFTGTLKGGSSPYSVMMSGSLVSRPGPGGGGEAASQSPSCTRMTAESHHAQ